MPRTLEKVIIKNTVRPDVVKKFEKRRDMLILRGLSKRRLADGGWIVGREAVLAADVHNMVDCVKPR